MGQRRGGIIQIKVDGILYDAKGSLNYNLGRNKREAIVGADGIHDYKEMPQVAFIEGEITDRGNLVLTDLLDASNATVTLLTGNGKTIVLKDAWFAGDGNVATDEGNITIRFESANAQEFA